MPTFACRWPNGDFSIVVAANKDKAEYLLDEVGNPDAAELFTVKDFMVHFRLKTNLTEIEPTSNIIELEGFGEQFDMDVLEKLYPIYEEASHAVFANEDKPPAEGELEADLQKLNEALAAEHERVKDKKITLSSDPRCAAIQQHMDAPKSMIENIAASTR